MDITFYGAAREVTGSKHMIQFQGRRLLLDAGFFQGRRQEAEEKNRQLPFAGKDIDAVILSHAHLDHCGSLPTLYKTGFRGTIFATSATADVARIMLEDSADIQVHDAAYLNRHKMGKGTVEPLYTQDEAKGVMNLFHPVRYYEEFEPLPNIRARFLEAGHILGSAQVELTFKISPSHYAKLGFTGDLGRRGLPILKDPDYFDQLDFLVSESTYGNRLHEDLGEIERLVTKTVRLAHKNKSKIIVPAFALGRTQAIIYVLHKLTDQGKIPRLPIYIDSPMATEVTDVFLRHQDNFDKEIRTIFMDENNPFSFRNLHFTPSVDESKMINMARGPFMVVSTSGMCETGRIRHHLKNSIEKRENIIMITGFMAQNTLGRKIINKEKTVRIFDRRYHVRANVMVINAFSAHADQKELLDHIRPIKGLKKIFLVHGEKAAQDEMGQSIKKIHPHADVDIPACAQQFEL